VPKAFDVSVESTATVAEVRAAFADAGYWRDRLAQFGGDSIRLDSLVVESDAIFVRAIQDLRNDVLPTLIAKAIPGDLKVYREETWRMTGDGDFHGDVVLSASGAPLSGVATAVVSPIGQGSVLRFTGTVQMKVPLIGGPVEKYISSQIVAEIPGLQHFTTRWILEKAPKKGTEKGADNA
jgi:hypothetical protein